MAQITSVELVENYILKVGYSYYNNLFESQNVYVNVYYQGQTDPTTMQLSSLLALFQKDASSSRGSFNFVSNRLTYLESSGAIIIGGTTMPCSSTSAMDNLFSNNVYIGDDRDGVTFTFSGTYDNDGTETSFSFELDFDINGYKTILLTNKFDYVKENTNRFSLNNFNISGYDGYNNIVEFVEGNGLYKTYTLTAIKNESESVSLYSLYTQGLYGITITLMAGNRTLATNTTQIKCYSATPNAIRVNAIKTSYLQGEQFSTNDINVYSQYPIYSTYIYEQEVFNYTESPSPFVNVAQSQQVTITWNNLTSTYNVSVSANDKDRVYYFLKKAPHTKTYLGELQCDFNMSLTLDETKDSCKIMILSYTTSSEIEPNTFVYLESTDTWWCVEKDKVVRHQNESDAVYVHTLSLKGAFEVLNARDLTNCGFNSERYTVGQFLTRLMTFSDFEIQTTFNYGSVIDSSKRVDYLKTFENYSTSSAIKEFLNGYNAIPKMRLHYNGTTLDMAYIDIYSKSGTNVSTIDISIFDDTTAQTSIDSENYGSRVVSNVQNCVGNLSTNYPAIGLCNLVGANGEVTYETASSAKLRLPSPAYYVESITLYTSPYITVNKLTDSGICSIVMSPDDAYRGGKSARDSIVAYMRIASMTDQEIQDFIDDWDTIMADIKPLCSKTITNGGYYDAINDVSVGDYAEAYSLGRVKHAKIFLNNEIYSYNSDGTFYFNLTWKQGSNEIGGFGLFQSLQRNALHTGYAHTALVTDEFSNTYTSVKIKISQKNVNLSLLDSQESSTLYPRTLFSVKYVPMSDIKVKTENDRDYNDTKLFNQNGKLIDGYAVSKLINGYATTISSNEIVLNKTYYSFFDIPKIGQRVKNGNYTYVINNISYDFCENDNNHYCIPCQFTMTKYSACKSNMISANSKIRDYDCPQENNIKRIQCYRDYIELDYTRNNVETPYLSRTNLINLTTSSIGIKDNLCCFVRAEDSSFWNTGDNNSQYYYYRIPHTLYTLNKHYMIVADYGDNNIIGYGDRSADKPFTLTNIFNSDRTLTVPISYVDSYGEVDGLETIFTDIDTAKTAFGSIYISNNCAISGDIYRTCKASSKLTMTENYYDKDGLEVPVFQYSAECGDTNGIVMADNFFEYGSDYDNFVIITYENQITNENSDYVANNGTITNATLSFSGDEIFVTPTTSVGSLKNKNVGVYAKKDNTYRFLFACNGYRKALTYIDLFVNNYKLN